MELILCRVAESFHALLDITFHTVRPRGNIQCFRAWSGNGTSKHTKSDRPLLHQIRRQQKTEQENQNHLIKKMNILLIRRATSHVDGETVPIGRVVTDILPCVRNTFQNQDADVAKIAFSDMLSWRTSPTRSRRKEVRKDQLLC